MLELKLHFPKHTICKESALEKSIVTMVMMAKILVLFAVVMVASSPTPSARASDHNITRIEFYMHDIISGSNQTAVRVAGRDATNATTTGSSSNPFAFGSIYVIDNVLTVSPNRSSTAIGRAQGLYAVSSMSDLSLLMTLTCSFNSGPYNGSSLSILGWNPVMKEVREMPVIGGTGAFRLARGYCFADTASMSMDTAVIGYNVTLIH